MQPLAKADEDIGSERRAAATTIYFMLTFCSGDNPHQAAKFRIHSLGLRTITETWEDLERCINRTPVCNSSKRTSLTTPGRGTHPARIGFDFRQAVMEATMGFGRGALLWLIGIPLPIILLLAIFMHH
jgi:hypothetical protein